MTLLSESRARLHTTAPSKALKALPVTALTIDLVVIVVTGGLAAIWRESVSIFDRSAEISGQLGMVGPSILAVWLLIVALLGGYDVDVFGAGTDEYKRVFNASLLAAGLVGVGCYMARYDLSRGFFIIAFLLGTPALVVGRYGLRTALKSARRRGTLQQRALIAGSRAHIDELARVLRRESWLGYQIAGALTPEYDLSVETDTGIPVLGNADEVTSIAKAAAVDVIFLAGGAVGSATQMQRIVWDLEHEKVQVIVAPSVTDISSERIKVRPVGGLPLMHIDPPRATDASRWAKRLFDICGSATLILLFAPLLAFAALRIKLHDRGPIMFVHTRIGRNGKEFGCLKFRSMVIDAEAKIAELQAELGQSALLFKMKEDPRITKPGKWLRRYSVDELPQLFNVLKGDMSLIGPRPQVSREVALYTDGMARRLRVRPGMTGLWQVSGRNDLSVEEAIRLDLYYVDNWSMMQDLAILARTLRAVVGSDGAY